MLFPAVGAHALREGQYVFLALVTELLQLSKELIDLLLITCSTICQMDWALVIVMENPTGRRSDVFFESIPQKY